MKLLSVNPSTKNVGQAYVNIQDGVKGFEAWTPSLEAVKPYIGKELPDGWLIQESEYQGRPSYRLLPPKTKTGPQTAYRNTKEGQAYEQERMDRRTALMQAVACVGSSMEWKSYPTVAQEMYEWLRASSGADDPVRPETKPEGRAKDLGKDPEPTPPAPTQVEVTTYGDAKPVFVAGEDLWAQASEIGLSPPKAVMLARRLGWDDVLSSTDLSDDQLRELIETRRKELV